MFIKTKFVNFSFKSVTNLISLLHTSRFSQIKKNLAVYERNAALIIFPTPHNGQFLSIFDLCRRENTREL